MSNQALANRLKEYGWGNPINANYAGTTAGMRGSDLTSGIQYGAITSPEPYPFAYMQQFTAQDVANAATDSQTPTTSGFGSLIDNLPEYYDAIVKGGSATAQGGFTPLMRQLVEEYFKTVALVVLALIIIAIGVWALVK